MTARKRALKKLLPSTLIIVFLLISLHPFITENAAAGSIKGNLYLVGMGPGDPDLATIRAMEIVQEADLIICYKDIADRFSRVLTNKDVVSTDAWLWLGYGKKASDFQDDRLKKFLDAQKIRSQIIDRVRKAIQEKKKVAFLSCGDPLIYGDSVWVLEEFSDLKPQVVSGLSSFNVANSAFKKEVTGEFSRTVILTVPDPIKPETNATIDKLATHQATMVIFMPTLGKLKDMVAKLSKHYSPQTPIALVCHAGYKEKERIIMGTLKNITDKARNENLPWQYLIYIGDFLNYEMKPQKENNSEEQTE